MSEGPPRQLARVIVKRANSAERVAVALRAAIVRGELVAGQHVRQEEWAQRLGVSRAPAREALKILVAERLLTYDTHRGYFVRELDVDQMTDVYLIRTLLETEVLRTIRWPSPDELTELRAMGFQVVELVRYSGVHSALDAARALMFAIFDLSRRQFLVNEVKRYWGIAEIYRALSMGDAASSDPDSNELREYHRELFSALERHDRKQLLAHNTAWRTSTLRRLVAPR